MIEHPRFYKISASRFDGTTRPAAPWQISSPGNADGADTTSRNEASSYLEQDVVGRLAFSDLFRPGVLGGIVWIRAISEPEPNASVTLRSAAADELPPGESIITDQPLDLFPLLRLWSAPKLLGPTDAISIEHLPQQEGGAGVELMVAEVKGGIHDALINAAFKECCGGGGNVLASITLNAPAVVPAPAGDELIVFVNFDLGDATLPALAAVPLGRRITFIRIAPFTFTSTMRIVASTPASDQVNGQVGATLTPYLLHRPGDVVSYQRVPGGWAYSKPTSQPSAIDSAAPNIVVPRSQDGTQYVRTTGGAAIQLPVLSTCRVGFRVFVLNSTIAADSTILAAGGETINGLASESLPPGASVLLESTGQEWIALFSSRDPAMISSANAVINVSAFRGTQIVQATNAAATVNIPALNTIPTGTRLVVYNGGTGTVTIAPNGGDLINGQASWTVQRNQTVIITAGTLWTVVGGVFQSPNVVSAANIALGPWISDPQVVESTGNAAQTITLPDAALVRQGATLILRDSSANNHTLIAAGGQTVNGAANIAIPTATTTIVTRISPTAWFATIGA